MIFIYLRRNAITAVVQRVPAFTEYRTISVAALNPEIFVERILLMNIVQRAWPPGWGPP